MASIIYLFSDHSVSHCSRHVALFVWFLYIVTKPLFLLFNFSVAFHILITVILWVILQLIYCVYRSIIGGIPLLCDITIQAAFPNSLCRLGDGHSNGSIHASSMFSGDNGDIEAWFRLKYRRSKAVGHPPMTHFLLIHHAVFKIIFRILVDLVCKFGTYKTITTLLVTLTYVIPLSNEFC